MKPRDGLLPELKARSESPWYQDGGDAFFRSVEWTADGTTLIALCSNSNVSAFIVPSDLLEEHENSIELKPFVTHTSKEPVRSLTSFPYFSLQDPTTTLILSSVKDHPIRLNSALSPGLLASYPLVDEMTEAFLTPNTLHFTPDGRRFVTGSNSLISTFDLSRPGQEPLSSFRTNYNKRNGISNPAISMKGIVSALAIEPQSNLLAAGTFTRHIALYDAAGQGGCAGSFTVKNTDADQAIGGSGITQLLWSPCGRYLYVAERQSNGVMIYDIRNTGQLLCWLKGRHAYTNQRLGVELFHGESQDVWAGGTDGVIRVWRDAERQEGGVAPGIQWLAQEDAISSVVVYPKGGGVFATTSGQRHFMDVSVPQRVGELAIYSYQQN